MSENNMSRAEFVARSITGLGMIVLAGALVYFSYVLFLSPGIVLLMQE